MPTGTDTLARRYPLQVAAWRAIPGLVHGFLGRGQGISPGAFTLDELRSALRPDGNQPRLVAAARQVHGAAVLSPEDFAPLFATAPDTPLADVLPIGDALVSASSDLLLTIRTADCVPVLLVAPRAHAVAAVHAGWRGTLAGVLEAALAALHSRYGARSSEVSAAVGPAIGPCCYVFGAEHRDGFIARFGPAAAAAWHPGTDPRHGRLDLGALCRLALEGADVPAAAIATLGVCTVEHPRELHSFRRDGPHAGRQLSYIGWAS